MVNVKRLLDAIARELPSTSERADKLFAVQVAANSLPISEAKVRNFLLTSGEECIDVLDDCAQKCSPRHITHDEAPTKDLSLAGILTGVSPEKRAEEALDGFVAKMSHQPVDVSTFRAAARLAPLVLGESVNCPHFLAFLLAAPARLNELGDDELARVGRFVAHASCGGTATSALRLSLSAEKLELTQCRRLSLTVLPLIQSVFHSWVGKLSQEDLSAALHALRFVCLCERTQAVREARETLCGVLAHMDATSLREPLLHLMQSRDTQCRKAVRRWLSDGDASKAVAASFVVEVLEGLAAFLTNVNIEVLVEKAGLSPRENVKSAPAGDDVFFEDVGVAPFSFSVDGADGVGVEKIEGVESFDQVVVEKVDEVAQAEIFEQEIVKDRAPKRALKRKRSKEAAA